jgi:hypothetical protein
MLRLHDPARRPTSWTAIMRANQFAAFVRDLETDRPCDAGGVPFDDPAAAACAVFDSIEEARAFCGAAVERDDRLQFDIFDAAGRAHPPLLTVLHPRRAAALDTAPTGLRRRRLIGWSLLVPALPVLVLAYLLKDGGHQIFAGFIGINLLVAGGRLLWFNLGVRETERVRQVRLASAARGERHQP